MNTVYKYPLDRIEHGPVTISFPGGGVTLSAWLTAPDPLDDQLTRERATQQTPRGGAATAALAATACLGLLVTLLAAAVYGWLASPGMWV